MRELATAELSSYFPGGSLPGMLVIDTCTMEIVYKAGYFNEAEILAAASGI